MNYVNQDYSEEVKALVKDFEKENITFGKNFDLLSQRIRTSKEEIEEKLLTCNNLLFTKKQLKDKEV